MEILDVVDEKGNPTGQIIEREEAHRRGIRHRTAHVWLLRRRGGQVEMLMQKRSDRKDSNPGCYDVSSAGHIPAGVDFVSSAVRELQEELGLVIRPEELMECGNRSIYNQNIFYGKEFIDNQYSRVYAVWKDVEPSELHLQGSEVSAAVWISYEKCLEGVEKNLFANCISLEELNMLKKFLAGREEKA